MHQFVQRADPRLLPEIQSLVRYLTTNTPLYCIAYTSAPLTQVATRLLELAHAAVVLVLCNTLVLYCRTLACGACMHALTASLYLHSKVADLSSMSGNAIWLPANLLALVNCKAVVLVLCNTLVLYCKAGVLQASEKLPQG